MQTNDALSLINTRIRDIAPYHLQPEPFAIKLNQNENPFDWPKEIKEELAQFCKTRPWNRYPNFIPDELKQKLADYVGVGAASVCVGNGSNEMLLTLMLSLADCGHNVIICQPTFTVYRLLATGVGAVEQTVMLNPDLSFNVPAICAAAKAYPRSVLILCSPNNPTGTALTEDEIRSILSVHTGFLILDQAYIEFGGYNALPLLSEYPNLIITRTFSKAFAGAGLRLGYMIAAPEIMGQINKIKLPYNINFFSEQVGITLLSHTNTIREQVAFLVDQRKKTVAALSAIPLVTVFPSAANFFMFRCDGKTELLSHLKNSGILVRDVSSNPLCENCLRVNVGTVPENEQFISAVRDFFGVKNTAV